MRPGWLHLVLSLNSSFRKLKVRLLEVGEGSEDVFLNHCHDVVEVGDNEGYNGLLVLQQLLDLVDSV